MSLAIKVIDENDDFTEQMYFGEYSYIFGYRNNTFLKNMEKSSNNICTKYIYKRIRKDFLKFCDIKMEEWKFHSFKSPTDYKLCKY